MLEVSVIRQPEQIQKREDEAETYARVTAPEHITANHFTEHHKIEGYFEDRDVPDFMGSDRLLKIDTLYGTVQLGYNPQKGNSFLFANIKTSIFDHAASRWQKELKEYQMKRTLKTGNQNVEYVSKRKSGSATLLYKMENKPWSYESIAPYLFRVNHETLRKTMPFLDTRRESQQRAENAAEKKRLELDVYQGVQEGSAEKVQLFRRQERELLEHQNYLNHMLARKNRQSRHFFRKLNIAFDLQKQDMFAYYRSRRQGGAKAEAESIPADTRRDEDEND